MHTLTLTHTHTLTHALSHSILHTHTHVQAGMLAHAHMPNTHMSVGVCLCKSLGACWRLCLQSRERPRERRGTRKGGGEARKRLSVTHDGPNVLTRLQMANPNVAAIFKRRFFNQPSQGGCAEEHGGIADHSMFEDEHGVWDLSKNPPLRLEDYSCAAAQGVTLSESFNWSAAMVNTYRGRNK